jgi:DNA repair protein RadC
MIRFYKWHTVCLYAANMSLCKLPIKSELPRERLKNKGAEALSDSELLALLLGTGGPRENVLETASRIISETGGIERMYLDSIGSLCRYDGMGEAKAARIIAAVEFGIRVVERRTKYTPKSRFLCSSDIYQAYNARMSGLSQEIFLVVGLNNKNETVTEMVVAKGSVNECLVTPREVFRPLIAEACAKMIALHNHPSGDPSPSAQDISLTRRLCKVGDLLNIPVLDHIIIGAGRYASFRDLGLMSASL